MGARETVPSYCKARCIAARDTRFDEAPVYFSAECEGPGWVSPSDPKQIDSVHIEVQTGDTSVIEESYTLHAGQLVCRNTGLNESMLALLAESKGE